MSTVTAFLLDVRNQVGIFVTFVIGYYTKKIFFDSHETSSKKWKSPFAGDSRIPATPLETNQAKRNVVMKRAFTKQFATEKKWDAIVIGSGIGGMTIGMTIIISDAGLHNTLQDLLPENIAKRSPSWPMTGAIKPAFGNLSVFIGMKGAPKEFGLSAQNVWAFSGSNTEESFNEILNAKSSEELLSKPYPCLFLSSGSAKDSEWEQQFPGRSVMTVMSFIPYSLFSRWSETTVKKRGDEYNALKYEIGQNIIDQVVHIFPKLKNNIDYYSVGTPVTVGHYLSTKEGGTFNMSHDIDRFCPKQSSLLRPESGIKGLYFTGQDVTSCGFSSCMLSGFLCASVILNKRYSLLYELYAQHKKQCGPPKSSDDLFW